MSPEIEARLGQFRAAAGRWLGRDREEIFQHYSVVRPIPFRNPEFGQYVY
jgi:hypothetical protein